MDLLNFLEGLGFLIAAAVAFELRGGLRLGPWGLIASFAFLYGISIWLGLMVMALGASTAFTVAGDALRAVSALALLEAVRRSLPAGGWRRAGLVAHLLLVAVLAAEVLGGGDVDRLLSRWLIPPASAAAAVMLLAGVRSQGRGFLLGITMAGAGLVLHAIGEIPSASGVSGDWWGLTGALAFASGLALAAQVHAGWPEEYRRQRRQRMLRFLILLVGCMAIGMVAIEGSGSRARANLRRNAETTVTMLASQVEVLLATADLSAALVAHWPETEAALAVGADDPARAVLDRRMDAFRAEQGLSVVYVLDPSGRTILATNRDQADSLVGKAFAYRSYFNEAMAGRQGRYWARGAVTLQRGFYASAPVRDRSGMIIGVAVVKQDAARLDAVLRAHPLALLISRDGVVFAASDQACLDHVLPGRDGERFDSRQYGPGPFPSLFPGGKMPEADRTLDGIERLPSLGEAHGDGWRVLVLADLSTVAAQRLVVFAMLGLVSGLVLVGYVAMTTLGDRNWELQTSRRELSAALAEAERARAAAEAAARAKATFLAMMSHEIRTPLNGVIGMADVLLREPLHPAARNAAGTIRRSGEILLGLVNDILDFSRIEAGGLVLEHRTFAIRELAEEVVALFRPDAAGKGIALVLAIAEDVPALTAGDPLRVRQILTNLIGNAVKFTRQGGVRIRVTHLPADPAAAHGWMELTISDSGIGIPAEALPRLFRMFTQVDAGTARRFGGSGLGLAITSRLVDSMGGDIAVDSRPGGGSTFRVRLPLADPATLPSSITPLSMPTLPPTGRRVLLAEDDAVNRQVAAGLFKHLGIEAEIVEDGSAVVAAWERGGHDLILMDVQMPGLDGPAATRLIREREALRGRTRIPIIAMTANVFTEDRLACLAAGMDDLVAKPVTLQTLGAALSLHLRPAGG